MKTKRSIKILSLICAMIIFFSTVCPNITLAANEIRNIVSNENLISTTNVENTKTKDNIDSNKIQNNTLEKQTNEITNEENNIIENTLNIADDKEKNEIIEKKEKDDKAVAEDTEEKLIEKNMIINGKEELIVMKDTEDINSTMNINKRSARSANGMKLYVLHNASYISTTVHHREDRLWNIN